MSKLKRVPKRQQIKLEDTWDLSSLYVSDESWETAFRRFQRQVRGYRQYQGKLGRSASVLADCLAFDQKLERLGERLGTYAFLKTAEDQANSRYQAMRGRFENAATRAAEAASYIRPEIMEITPEKMQRYLQHPKLRPYRVLLERMLRYRDHTLSQKEEELLAMQGEMAQVASRAFRQLLDTDMQFGTVQDEKGRQIELTSATFLQLLHSPRREVRRTAFHQYYQQFRAHQNTLAATLAGSIQKDVYYARARGYASSLDAALFAEQVPAGVYDSLVTSVRDHLPPLHRYYELRRRKMKLRQIHFYDTYVPILSELKTKHTWTQAVETVLTALQPLGSHYCSLLESGLRGRWCDRYPNQGKQSGAFSCGSYDGDPYILMNYKPEVLDDLFTLAHEAGHSMHSYYSARHQPFAYHDYTIFVAEVASTFNEQLLSRYLMQNARDDRHRAYLINRDIDAIRATIFRQTMFAEFEKIAHEAVESGEPLTVQSLQGIYWRLLEAYFGPGFTLDQELGLECLRIPHFYRAFYVYKYATGMSAAIALSQRVLEGGRPERDEYLSFLKGGCSKDPLDLLRDAGVDMQRPEPIQTALVHFERLVGELEELC